MNKKQTSKQRARAGLPRVAVFAAVTALVACAWAASRSVRSGAEQERVARARASARPAARATAPANRAKQAAGSAWPYQMVVSRNLFKPLKPAAPVRARTKAVPPAVPLEALDLPDFDATPSQPPKTEMEWVYVGFATVDGRPLAIIENTSTKVAQFVAVGDKLDGFTVSDISAEAVRLTSGGESKQLKISDAFTATPLNAPPTPARSAQQGQSGRGPGRSAMGGLADTGLFRDVILPAIRSNPQYAEEAQQLMGRFMGGRRGRFGGGPPGFPFGGGPGNGTPQEAGGSQ